MLPQPFVRLLFSFTCGFDRMQPLKSRVVASLLRAGAGVEGGELLFAFEVASDVNLFRNNMFQIHTVLSNIVTSTFVALILSLTKTTGTDTYVRSL